MIPPKSFMQFLAPPPALSCVFLLTGSRVMWRGYVKSTKCSTWGPKQWCVHLEEKRQTKINISICFQKQSCMPTTFPLDISSHCAYNSAEPLKPAEMFMEDCCRLSGIVVTCLWRQFQKTVTEWLLTSHRCYISLLSVLPCFGSCFPYCWIRCARSGCQVNRW